MLKPRSPRAQTTVVWKVVQLVLGAHSYGHLCLSSFLCWLGAKSHNPGLLVGLEPTTLSPHLPPSPPHTHTQALAASPYVPLPHSSSETWGPQPITRQAKSRPSRERKQIPGLTAKVTESRKVGRQTQHPVSWGLCIFHSFLEFLSHILG